jgi:hypothetical protein
VCALVALDAHRLDGQEDSKGLPNLIVQPKLIDGVDVDLINVAQDLLWNASFYYVSMSRDTAG